MRKTLISLLGVLAAGLAQAASVDVSFIDPDRFTDGGEDSVEARMVKTVLNEHFTALGQRYLPAGQQLKIDVLDIDLAGEVRYRGARSRDPRLLLGGVDWPRIHLRYTLQEGDTMLHRGEARIADMDYMNHVYTPKASVPLYFERRMLEEWFHQQFAANTR